METTKQLKRIRRLLFLFMLALFISGLTAIPVDAQLSALLPSLNEKSSVHHWLQTVLLAYKEVSTTYPFLFYGYDWLAFAHFILTLLFVGPYRDPVRNIWVIQFGLIACVLVLPFAFIAGHFRNIPLGWRLIDCSFGVIGFLLLFIVYKKIKLLAVHAGDSTKRSSRPLQTHQHEN